MTNEKATMRTLDTPVVLPERVDIKGDRRLVVLGAHKSRDLLSICVVSELSWDLLDISLDPVDPKLKSLLGEGDFYVKAWSFDVAMREALLKSEVFEVADDKNKAWVHGVEIWRLKGPALAQYRQALDDQEVDGEDESAGEAPKA